MKKTLQNLWVVMFSVIAINAFAQERTITGKVTEAEDGTVIPGVNVTIKGTSIGTVTDAAGMYSINAPSDATLSFSFIGFISQEIAVGSRSSIDVSMTADITQLSEVVVTAYGVSDKRSFTGSVGEINSEQIQKRPLANVANALVGTISGVQTTAASGQPGSAPGIRIRGIGSINASNDPLYVVDGVPYDQGISNLNPNDIESMTVLKDAASSTLYGSRAANGVIMVTTKRGKEGKTRFNFSTTQGSTSRAIPEYERVNAREYYTLFWESYRNSQVYGPLNVDPTIAAQNATNDISTLLGYNPFNVPGNQLVNTSGEFNPNAQQLYTDTDWFVPLERNGYRGEYNMNYSGGTSTSDYFVSVGYLDEKGYIINSDFDRWTARINLNTRPLKWFKTGVNMTATYTEANNARTDGSASFVNPFRTARAIGPIYPVWEHDPVTGEFIRDDNGNRIYDLGFGPPARPSGASPGRHPVQETELNKTFYKRTVVSGRGYAEADFLKYFNFKVNAGVDLYSYYETGYDNKIVGDGAPAGRANRINSTETSITLNQLLSFRKTILDKHNVSALVGHESYSFVDNNFSASKQAQIVDGIDELINFTEINSATSSTSDEAIESFLSRVEYDYNGKYFVSGSFRRDGSSRFSPEKRWGNFFSVGASWRMETEAFMSNLTWVNALKLRASYGQTGNRAIGGYYPSQGLYALGFNNAGEPGYLQSNISNPDLGWEKNAQFDVGTDFVLFNNRLTGTLEYYSRASVDLLFDVPLPLSSGSPEGNIARNIGEMQNRGIEITLGGDVVRAGDFTWNLSINAATISNKITSLPVDEFVTGTKKLKEGKDIYAYWLREYYGVNSENGAPLYRLNTESNTYNETSDVVIGSDTLTSNQSRGRFHYAGSALPDLYGGITNTFRYKGLSLTILTTYQIGGLVYDAGYQSLMAPDYGVAIHKDALNRWSNSGDEGNIPRMDVGNNNNIGATSDRWLTSGSHLNIRQITLNYNFPRALLTKAGLGNASVYLSGENLRLFSERQGMNVSQNFTGVTSNVYIPSRVFTVGLNVGF